MARGPSRRELERWHQRRGLALTHAFATAPMQPPAATLPATWTGSDLAWERCQEQAAVAARAGDPSLPPELWTRGLGIARRWFERGDPRLATSLTNQALVLRRREHRIQAEWMLAEALQVWDEAWRWVAAMQPPADCRRGATYDEAAVAAFMALVERGRAATAALERYEATVTIASSSGGSCGRAGSRTPASSWLRCC